MIGKLHFQFLLLVSFGVCVYGQAGDPMSNVCRLQTGAIGHCSRIRNCPYAETLIKENRRPDLCSYRGFQPIVCCPNSPTESTKIAGEKSRKKCSDFHDNELSRLETYFGGRFKRQFLDLKSQVFAVVGGLHSEPQEYPHMAALGFGSPTNKRWQCGGTLISEKFVITAAHCLNHRELGELKFVRLGDLNLETSTDLANPQDFQIARKIAHPDYEPPSQYNDLALVELDRAVTINEFVKPACLHTTKDIIDTRPSAIGWGLTEFGGEQSPHLQKVFLSFFTTDECKKSYATVPKSRLANGINDDTQICAGGRGSEAKDTCQGDSGGPLQIENFDLDSTLVHTIAGITSFGKSCGLANNPGVYTRISAYIGWIEDIVWPN